MNILDFVCHVKIITCSSCFSFQTSVSQCPMGFLPLPPNLESLFPTVVSKLSSHATSRKLCNLVPLRPPLTAAVGSGYLLMVEAPVRAVDRANLNHSVMWTCLKVWSVFYQVTTVDSFLCSCDWASLGRVAQAGFQPCIYSTSLVRREEAFTIWWMVFMLHAAERCPYFLLFIL